MAAATSHPPVLTDPVTGETFPIYPGYLPVDGGRCVTIFVDDTPDEISLGLRAGSYRLPAGFDLLPQLAPPGGRVLDLGGHVGVFALAAAALGYEVMAVEASPRNAALLAYSAAAHGLSERVQVVHAAVGDHEGTVEFLHAGPYGFVANPHVPGPTVTVRLATVAALLAEAGWTAVDFIKLDVEGSEAAALAGMAALLDGADAPPILFESNSYTLHLFDADPYGLRERLALHGYRSYQVDWGRLAPVQPADLQPESCLDYLAVKRPLPPLRGWQIVPPIGAATLAARLAASAHEAHPHARLHAARTLAAAPLSLLCRPEIIDALDRLVEDGDEQVRAAAAWWWAGTPSRRAQALARRRAEEGKAALRRAIRVRLQRRWLA
ncbi:MAG TPA: FkbM family methyltransferase [Caldilineaceae bacterium]|nr:FkbM family methyltransferase [Caldilineaceae bacterium]